MWYLLSVMLWAVGTSASSPATSTPYISVVGDQEDYSGSGGVDRSDISWLDNGPQFLYNDVLTEMEHMGLRPSRTGGACTGTCGGHPRDNAVLEMNNLNTGIGNYVHKKVSNQTELNKKNHTVDNNLVLSKNMSERTSREVRNVEDTLERTSPVFSIALSAQNNDDNSNGNRAELIKNLSSMARIQAVDYSVDDGAEADVDNDFNDFRQPSNSAVARYNGQNQPSSGDMTDVADVLGPVKSERQARLFFNFDRAMAFNTSFAFTIPIFSFILPGSNEITSDGIDSTVFVTLAYFSMFLTGCIGVIIYTTVQTQNRGQFARTGTSTATPLERILKMDFPDSEFLSQDDPPPGTTSLNALHGLSEALSLPTCAQLVACKAYQNPRSHGALGAAVRMLVSLRLDANLTSLTPLEAAARAGAEGNTCSILRYPCIVDPLETAHLLMESKETSHEDLSMKSDEAGSTNLLTISEETFIENSPVRRKIAASAKLFTNSEVSSDENFEVGNGAQAVSTNHLAWNHEASNTDLI